MKKTNSYLHLCLFGLGACLLVAVGLAGVGIFYWLVFQFLDRQPAKVEPAAQLDPGGLVDKSPLDDFKGNKHGLRVLFVGNSHTVVNNVPELVTKLAKAANEDRPLMAFTEAPGGTSFKMHWDNGKVQKLLTEVKWDIVVLQDQSAMPNQTRAQRDQETLPFARKLNDKIKESGARTVLFMTWGYQHEFIPMQKRSRDAYQALAEDLKADLAPVGAAWEKALAARPNAGLFSADGNHAEMKGSYLAACVFYAVFYGKSPVGNSFTADLNAADARFLQESAVAVVRLQPGGLAAMAPPRVK